MPSIESSLASESTHSLAAHEDAAALSGVQFSAGAAPIADLKADEPLPTLDDAMRTHIARALVRARGRIEGKGGAADLLGVNPHTLRGKMRRLKIDWARFRTA